MNIFCRIFGHTWVHKVEDPKIRWTTNAKTLNELEPTVDGEPKFYMECARCGLKKDWAPTKVEIRLRNIQTSASDKGSEDPQEAAGASA